jgi:iron-sulfur cluster assembly protein
MLPAITPITLTEKAAQEIRYLMQNKNIPVDYGLRILVQGGGGCGGASFRLGFDKLKEGDLHYTFLEVPIFYEKKQMLFLIGLEIDFEERATEKGFVFNLKKAHEMPK